MSGKAGAFLGALLTAAVMMALVVPSADSGATHKPKLKLKTILAEEEVANGTAGGPSVECPSGYHLLGGGFSMDTSSANVTYAGRSEAQGHPYHVNVINQTGGGITVTGVGTCAKGQNGLKISDRGTGLGD
jgi:hypothetical protein